MTLPRFFTRVRDSITPVADIDPELLEKHLDGLVLAIHAPDTDEPSALAAGLLAANLAARLYPHIHLSGSADFKELAGQLVASINPSADIHTNHEVPNHAGTVGVTFAKPSGSNLVRVASSGWNVGVDSEIPSDGPGHPLASLASAAMGMGEAFRSAFADTLGAGGRRGPQPASFNLLTLGSATAKPYGPVSPELPSTHLVGAGAIGQACLHALIAADTSGDVTVIDPQSISLSNLQRYILTTDDDVGAAKTALAERAAEGTGLRIHSVPTRWGADSRTGPGVTQAAIALDTAGDRLEVAAGLPGHVYNAWTQPADIGWSWHEEFGTRPCLACLYYPTEQQPSEHELIAAALGQHPLRTLTYLVRGTPVGQPLPEIAEVATIPAPMGAPSWLERSLLQDLVATGRLTDADADVWAAKSLGSLYRDGVCAGGLLTLQAQETEAVVPLAHQSALAGIMLALQLVVAADPELRAHRSSTTEGRLDMLRPLSQRLPRPRQLTPGCLCSDRYYQRAQSVASAV